MILIVWLFFEKIWLKYKCLQKNQVVWFLVFWFFSISFIQWINQLLALIKTYRYLNISGNPVFGGRTYRGLSKWYSSHVRTTQYLRKNGQTPKLQKHGITFVWQKFAIVLIKIWDFSQSNHYRLICLPT